MAERTFGLIEPVDGDRKAGGVGLPRQHPDPAVDRTETRVGDDEGGDVPIGTVGEAVTNAGHHTWILP